MSRSPSPDLDETSVSTNTSYDTTSSSRAEDETYIEKPYYSSRSLRLGKERNSLLLRQQQQSLLHKQKGLLGFGVNRFLLKNCGGASGAKHSGSFSGIPLATPPSPFGSSAALSSLVTPASPCPSRQLSWTPSIDGELPHEALSLSGRSLPFSEFSVTTYDDFETSSFAAAAPTHLVLALKQQVGDLQLQLETVKLESSTRQMQYESQIKSLQSTCREQLRMIEVLAGEDADRDWHREARLLREHSSHYHLMTPSLAGNTFLDAATDESKEEEDDDAESRVVEESHYLVQEQSAMIQDMRTDLDANDSAMDSLLEEIDAFQRRQKVFLSKHSTRPTEGKSGVASATKTTRNPQEAEEEAGASILQLQGQIAALQGERDAYKNRFEREEAKTQVAVKALAVAQDRMASFERFVATFSG